MKKTKMLKKNYEFSQVFSKGTCYSENAICAFVLKNNKNSGEKNDDYNYLGLAISTKAGHAYQRNKVKRLLRENYMNFENDIISGFSIVFLLNKNKNIDEIDFYTIKQDMEKILRKAGIIK